MHHVGAQRALSASKKKMEKKMFWNWKGLLYIFELPMQIENLF